MKRNATRILVLLLVLLLSFSLVSCKKSSSEGEADPSAPAASEQSQQAEHEQSQSAETAEDLQDEDYSWEDLSDQDEDYSEEGLIDEYGTYDQKDDVALYIHVYGRLPDNYITKKQAEKLGWHGGSVEQVAPGKCIGGGHYGNYEGLLPKGNYKECDIGTLGKSKRGAKRIIYSDEGDIYYTSDHYKSFTKLYDKNGAC